ncbi:MAG: type II toxin-antitoxin system VapC family toxin [Thermoprotei archaeon]
MKKYYVDTSVLLALANPKDPNHERASDLISVEGEKWISDLVVLEAYSVLSRKSGLKGEELDAAVKYLVRNCGCEVKYVDFAEAIDTAKKLAGEARLKTLDLLHLAMALLADSDPLTLDKELDEAFRGLRDERNNHAT